MTKEEFFKIVDSGDSENYSNNPEFISFSKQAFSTIEISFCFSNL